MLLVSWQVLSHVTVREGGKREVHQRLERFCLHESTRVGVVNENISTI